jgi:P4 family phage/plasmid primase-like protien
LTFPFGKFNIPNDAIETLNNIILEAKNTDFGMCEVHDDSVPEMLYLDIDFVLKEKVDITDNTIKSFLEICQIIFKKNLKDYDATVFIFKKPIIEKDTTGYHYKNGYHIYFPYINLYANERLHIHQEIVEEVEKKKLFNNLPLVIEDTRSIIDYRVIKTNAILKVFCNKPKKQTYQLYKVFDSKLKECNKKYSDEELIKLLSIRKNLLCDKPERTNFITELIEEKIDQKVDLFFDKSNISYQPSLKDIEKLLSMLSLDRCKNYSSWLNVGLCLHNIDESLFESWKNWSKNASEKASKTRFIEIWKNFKKKDNGLKYGSLVAWAKTDSPEEYLKFRNEQISDSIKQSLEFNIKTKPAPIDIARILKEKFGETYVCSSITNKRWYEFRGTIWKEVEQGYSLFNQISDYLINEYKRQEMEIYSELSTLTSQEMTMSDSPEKSTISNKKKDLQDTVAKVQRLILALKDTTFKKKVMEEAMHLFFDETFEQNLNEMKNILVFNNGVFDLDRGILREGRPRDFMTYSTGIDYKEYDENDPDIQKILHIFSQIHPNEEIRNFFFSTLGVSLHGNKVEQKCNIWTGNGSNGKSLTSELCHKALGDFYHSPNITLFTRKTGASGNASPEKIVLKGRRIIIMQEPENDDKLNTSIMKQITGNDMIEARPLYHETIRFKPQTSVFISCNDLPKVPTTDGGTWRRIRVVPFNSKFVNNPTKPNEYKIDPHLTDKAEKLAEAFMSVMIYYYNSVKHNNFIINEPKEVTIFTDEYKNDNDQYQDFISQHIVDTGNQKDRVKIMELYDMFKDWMKFNNPTAGAISKKDFQRHISVKIGVPKTTQSWTGFKIKNLENEDDYAVIF